MGDISLMSTEGEQTVGDISLMSTEGEQTVGDISLMSTEGERTEGERTEGERTEEEGQGVAAEEEFVGAEAGNIAFMSVDTNRTPSLMSTDVSQASEKSLSAENREGIECICGKSAKASEKSAEASNVSAEKSAEASRMSTEKSPFVASMGTVIVQIRGLLQRPFRAKHCSLVRGRRSNVRRVLRHQLGDLKRIPPHSSRWPPIRT